MTFEERLDRLTERHEALTQSVELLGHQVEALTAANQQTLRNFEVVLDSIKRLENIALIHEHRISRLEGVE